MTDELNVSPKAHFGTAGWSIPRTAAEDFPTEGTHIERYARVLDAVEINTSFYRPHRVSTYERWAGAVPDTFRFAVKVPRAITHVAPPQGTGPLLDRFLEEVAGLGPKLGPLLVQTPPSLPFEIGTADLFLQDLRGRVSGPIACEPRHPSWFAPEIDALLSELRIGRVAADPAPVAGGDRPGGWSGLTYLRLHGSPRIYYSDYPDDAIQAALDPLAQRHAKGSDCWCIFDNTAAGAATHNALTAKRMAKQGFLISEDGRKLLS
jgi:uncharacterized protein YecE (DUF72 family)